jgi:hypothetical protein
MRGKITKKNPLFNTPGHSLASIPSNSPDTYSYFMLCGCYCFVYRIKIKIIKSVLKIQTGRKLRPVHFLELFVTLHNPVSETFTLSKHQYKMFLFLIAI